MFKFILVAGFIFSAVFGKSLQGCEELPDSVEDDLLHLTLLHVNDIHSHFEEVNVNTGTCKDDMKSRRECYGGVSQMAGYIQQVRDADPECQTTTRVPCGTQYSSMNLLLSSRTC
jgi:2',3'-cyclic-nucleotide 2'-phosphodiesterase (5'-nucleotidase family)